MRQLYYLIFKLKITPVMVVGCYFTFCSYGQTKIRNEILRTSHYFFTDTPSFIKLNDLCIIDTFKILNNRNLSPLINHLKTSELKICSTIKEIPSFILNFLNCTEGSEFAIANPGELWQAGDAIVGNLPHRQLIFFGVSDSIALMTHYKGGHGKSSHILIFKIRNEKLIDFWCCYGFGTDLSNKQKIIKFLSKNKNKPRKLHTGHIYF